MIAIASFIGWILFAIFGGIGLPALPMDLLIEFKHRPKRIKLQEYIKRTYYRHGLLIV
jgi:LMBR1 domain-containing protein 1